MAITAFLTKDGDDQRQGSRLASICTLLICVVPRAAKSVCIFAQGPRGSYVVRESPLYLCIVYKFLYSGSDASITALQSVSCARSNTGGSSLRPRAFNPSFTPGIIVFVIHSTSSS